MVLVEESREACGLDGEGATRGAVCGGRASEVSGRGGGCAKDDEYDVFFVAI